MNSRLMAVAGLCVVAAGSFVWWRSNVTAPTSAPTPPAVTKAEPGVPHLDVGQDPTAVFQRAFWRRPAADDRILHAERREWKDAASGVEKWQWFVACQPGPAFREWFFKENPFEVVPVDREVAITPLSEPPAWFPPAAELAGFARFRNREGRFHVFHDLVTNRLFATDAGGGFAVSRK